MKSSSKMTKHILAAMTICAAAALSTLLAAGGGGGKAGSPTVPPSAEPILYNRDIRPILSDNCFYCHGPDKNKRKAKLRLDEREVAIEKKAIVPGKPEESELIKRINSRDSDELMPPAEAHKTLSAAQKDTLKRWIAQGAVYQAHWAWITPVRPPVPSVANGLWAKNPIDAFILKQLEARGLAPSKEADRATLLRRLSLDLIGLPPTLAEVEAFIKDASPNAYETQVDRLLASPHYGERMAAPWLDAVRFADTVGFHGDQNQNVFPYRDYVIDAFNRNKPFDQFTIEQIAGDLLPSPTTEQLTATCFNRLNMVTREGGAQPKEYLAKYQADRVRTVATTWLGATFGCAECHNHKFDPITQKDFYSLGAFFADVKQWGVYSDYTYTPNPDLKGFTNDYPFPPEIVVESGYLKRREEKLWKKVDDVLGESARRLMADQVNLKANEKAFETWCAGARGMLKEGSAWVVLKPLGLTQAKPAPKKPAAKAKAAAAKAAEAPPAAPAVKAENVSALTAQEDGSILFTGAAGMNDKVELELPAGPIASLRIEALPCANHENSIVRGNATSTMVQISAAIRSGGKDRAIAFYHADADLKDPRYANGHELIGVKDSWKTAAAKKSQKQTAVYLLDAPWQAKAGDQLVLTLNKNGLGCVRISVSPAVMGAPADPKLEADLPRVIPVPGGANENLEIGRAEIATLWRIYLTSTAADPTGVAEYRKIYREIQECRGGKNPVLITEALKQPLTMRILPRGNWQDESGEVVLPSAPHFLPGAQAATSTAQKRMTRLDLAKWLVSPENPLTSRVLVNRMWKQFFGNGLCNSVEDLGAQGEWPSHAELLDWLAVDFRESGWDMKRLVRMIVTSNAYRQSSNLRPELRELDPANRLLASQNPRRLEAEFVRDNALAAAGLLNLDTSQIGGPSAKPYQPPGYYVNIQFPDRNYISDTDDRQYRRGLYMHWQRTFLHPMLANFDAPSREDCICTRNVSNTPQQALTLLNDPTFVEAARVLAADVMTRAKDDPARLSAIYQRILLRLPRDNERASLEKFIQANRAYFKTAPDEAKKLIHVGNSLVPDKIDETELAVWTSACRVILNLHETITRY